MAALVLGCGRSQKTVYSGPGGKVTVKSDKIKGGEQTVTGETKEGKFTVTGGAAKEITEAELGAPVYPGAKVNIESKMEAKTAGAGPGFQQHVLFTPDSYDKVVAFYKKSLKDVKNEQNMSSGGSKMSMFQIGEGKGQMMVHIAWEAKEKRTIIQVMKAGK
jgi:hypothetical protein